MTSDDKYKYICRKAKLFQEATFLLSFFLPEVNILVQNGHGVLSRLVLCRKCMELACQVLHDHFGPVYLLQVSKNDDEKSCFLK